MAARLKLQARNNANEINFARGVIFETVKEGKIMRSKLFLLILLAVAWGVNNIANAGSAMSNSEHEKWLWERIKEGKTIKPGMTRAALLKICEIEGGLQSLRATKYILKSCPAIHVEIKFNHSGKGLPGKAATPPDSELIITQVSPLTLDYVITD